MSTSPRPQIAAPGRSGSAHGGGPLRGDIQGLRAIAVLSVIADHLLTRRAGEEGVSPARRRAVLAIAMGVIIGASIAWAFHETVAQPTWAYFSTLSRTWELGVAAVIAAGTGAARRIRVYTGLACTWYEKRGPSVCDDALCRSVVGNTVVYRDTNGHLTATFARTLVPYFEKTLVPLVEGRDG